MKHLKAGCLATARAICDRLPRSQMVRYVLLDVKNPLTATYLNDLRQLFANDRRLRFFKSTPPDLSAADTARALSLVQARLVPRIVAKMWRWDMVVVADHPNHPVALPNRVPVLRIPHGIGSKMVDGEDWYYGRRCFDSEGHLLYSRIFESSESRLATFSKVPAFAGIIRLVGDLRVDKLIEAQRTARPTHGNDKPTVLIAGSWQGNNLFEKLGIELLSEAKKLADRFSFIVRPHPHFFKTTASAAWQEFLQQPKDLGFVVSPPEEDLGDVMARSSAIICDDLSSVALYAAVLQKSIIIVPSGSPQVPQDGFPSRLRRIVPNLEYAKDLASLLPALLDGEVLEAQKILAAEINSRPGQSCELIRNEVYGLLNLEPNLTTADLASPHFLRTQPAKQA